jgi:hypothetical protein
MKKYFAIALMLVMSKFSIAQDQEKGVRFGLSLSPQLSWMTASDKNLSGNGTQLGLCYGLLMDVLIPTNYAFATGILISAEGGNLIYDQPTKFNSYGDSIFAAGTQVDYTTQYIQIPLTMKLRTNQIGYITYFGQFGLQGGVRIKSRADVTNVAGFTETKIDFSDDVTIADMGLVIGGGLEFELSGKTALHTSVQYYNGFIDATNNPDSYKTKSTLNHLKLQIAVYF